MYTSRRSNSLDLASQSMTMPLSSSAQQQNKDSEQYVKKTEIEIKKLHSLKRAHVDLIKETEQRRVSCKKMARDLDASIHKVNIIQNQSLIKQKEHFLKRHDEVNEKIKSIQSEIDYLRRERKKHIKQIDQGLLLIQNKRQKYDQMSQIVEQRKNLSEQQQDQIYELKLRNEDEKIGYQKKVEELADDMQRDKRETESISKYFSQEIPDSHLVGNFDTVTILKQRLQKLIIKNKEKVKIMDTYMRYLTIIDTSFNQIKESTGITDINEIQNTFIKSQEQNRSLLQYLDLLNQQIDHLSDNNTEINQKIERQIQENSVKRSQLSSTPADVTNQRAIKSTILKKKKYVEEFNNLLNQVSPDIQEQLENYSKGVFNKDLITSVKYEQEHETFNLNVKTIQPYLSDLQEFSNKLIEYQAYKINLPLISILDLENVAVKQFSQQVQKQMNQNTYHLNMPYGEEKKLLDRNALEQFAKEHIQQKVNGSAVNMSFAQNI